MALLLLIGAILAPGKRTVASVLRLLPNTILPWGQVVLGIDETIQRRWEYKINKYRTRR